MTCPDCGDVMLPLRPDDPRNNVRGSYVWGCTECNATRAVTTCRTCPKAFEEMQADALAAAGAVTAHQ